MNIEMQQGILKIRIENSYNGKIVFDRERGYQELLSTKKVRGLHGIGLRHVRRMVEKYDGIMEIYPDSSLFRVVLILYMPEVKK